MMYFYLLGEGGEPRLFANPQKARDEPTMSPLLHKMCYEAKEHASSLTRYGGGQVLVTLCSLLYDSLLQPGLG